MESTIGDPNDTQYWEEECGTFVSAECHPYIFVGSCSITNASTGHEYHPVFVDGVWRNASSGKRLPQHMIGTDAEMEQFRMPPVQVYAAWIRAQRAQVQPAVHDAVDEAEVQLQLGEELYGNLPCWEHDVDAEYVDDDCGDDDGAYDFGVGEGCGVYVDAPFSPGGLDTMPSGMVC